MIKRRMLPVLKPSIEPTLSIGLAFVLTVVFVLNAVWLETWWILVLTTSGVAFLVVKYPAEAFGWFILSSVTLDYYWQLGAQIKIAFLLILLLSLIIKSNGAILRTATLFSTHRALSFYLLILWIYAAISLPLSVNFVHEFIGDITTNTAANVDYYYVTTALRHSMAVIVVIAAVKLGFFSERLFRGMGFAWITLLITVIPQVDFSIILPLLCGEVGGVGFQSATTNRADWSIRFALATIALLYFIRARTHSVVSVLVISMIASFFSAGKGGLILLILGATAVFCTLEVKKRVGIYLAAILLSAVGVASLTHCYPREFAIQHYITQLEGSISIRAELYEGYSKRIIEKITQGTLLIPERSSGRTTTVLTTTNDAPGEEVPYSSPSGAHNLLLDILNSYGIGFGLVLVAILTWPLFSQTASFLSSNFKARPSTILEYYVYVVFVMIYLAAMVTIPLPINMLLVTFVSLWYAKRHQYS